MGNLLKINIFLADPATGGLYFTKIYRHQTLYKHKASFLYLLVVFIIKL